MSDLSCSVPGSSVPGRSARPDASSGSASRSCSSPSTTRSRPSRPARGRGPERSGALGLARWGAARRSGTVASVGGAISGLTLDDRARPCETSDTPCSAPALPWAGPGSISPSSAPGYSAGCAPGSGGAEGSAARRSISGSDDPAGLSSSLAADLDGGDTWRSGKLLGSSVLGLSVLDSSALGPSALWFSVVPGTAASEGVALDLRRCSGPRAGSSSARSGAAGGCSIRAPPSVLSGGKDSSLLASGTPVRSGVPAAVEVGAS